MTTDERSQAILALEPRLLSWARSLTSDPDEARALTSETLALAAAHGNPPSKPASARAWLFHLLRQRFYSIERSRNHRRSRSARAAELAVAEKRARLAPAAAETEAV